MVKVIMNFEVEDWDRWHTAFLANSKMREENDIKEIYVGHELENKNKVHVVYDTPEPDTLPVSYTHLTLPTTPYV